MRYICLRIMLIGVFVLSLSVSLQQVAWGAEFERRDVTFKSQGLDCAAWYYVPKELKSGERCPAIVMAHGFSLVKEAYLDKFAEKFAEAGFAVLVFDYRYLGASEGEPRGQLFYYEQHQDYRNAITWVSLQEEVDPKRIGIWGTSYSGGHVLHLGAFDKRVKAVVAQVPATNSPERNQSMGGEALLRRISWQAAQRTEQYATGLVKYFPVVALDGKPCVFPQKESYEFFAEVEKIAPSWDNRVTVETLEIIREYAPMTYIHLISPTPLLMIVASDDVLTSTKAEKEAFERAREPKKLVVFEGGHFDVYQGPSFDKASGAAVEWFEQYLKP